MDGMNWKGEFLQAFTFVVLPSLGVLATWLALRLPAFDSWSPRRWVGMSIALFLLTRVGTHLLVFPLFHYAGGDDLLRVWEPAARAVLEGRDPVPLLDNLYGPLFPVILAAGYGLTGGLHPAGIDIPFVIADACALVLLLRVASRRFPETPARRLTLAVLLSPLPWHNEVVRTQDESMFILFLLLTLDLLDRGREFPAAFAAALGTLCTKAIFPLWVFPLLVAAGGGWRRTTGRLALAAGLTVVGMAIYPALEWDFPGGFHPVIDVRGSTSWFLVPGGSGASEAVFRAGLAATVLLGSLAGWWAATREGDVPSRPALGVVAVQATFFVVCPFTLPPHLVHGLPFLAWQAMREGVCLPKAGWKATVLGIGYCIWQIPSIWLNSEFWSTYTWLIALFVLFWGWTGWLAVRGRPVPSKVRARGASPAPR